MDIIENEKNVQYFLDLIKKSRRGKFKLYIGMIAGVGKSYRMLQEAHELLENGVDVKVGFIETHGRTGTEAILQGIPVIPRKKIFYKGKELEEMDLDAILQIRPELVIVDELAHTNVEAVAMKSDGKTSWSYSMPVSTSYRRQISNISKA